jgi:glutaredoxin 3
MPDIEIYTTRFCPYCNAARVLLKRRGIVFREIDIAANWEHRDEMIRRANGCVTLPQIFWGDLHIGGLSELKTLDASGTLHETLARLSAASSRVQVGDLLGAGGGANAQMLRPPCTPCSKKER